MNTPYLTYTEQKKGIKEADNLFQEMLLAPAHDVLNIWRAYYWITRHYHLLPSEEEWKIAWGFKVIREDIFKHHVVLFAQLLRVYAPDAKPNARLYPVNTKKESISMRADLKDGDVYVDAEEGVVYVIADGHPVQYTGDFSENDYEVAEKRYNKSMRGVI